MIPNSYEVINPDYLQTVNNPTQYQQNNNNTYPTNQPIQNNIILTNNENNNIYLTNQQNQNNIFSTNQLYQNDIYSTNNQNQNDIYSTNHQNQNDLYLVNQQNQNDLYSTNQQNLNNIISTNLPGQNNIYSTNIQNPNNIYPTNIQNPNNIYPINQQNQNNFYPTTLQDPNNIYPTNQQNQINIYPKTLQDPNNIYPTNRQNQNNIYSTTLQDPNNIYPTNQQNQNNISPTNQQNQTNLLIIQNPQNPNQNIIYANKEQNPNIIHAKKEKNQNTGKKEQNRKIIYTKKEQDPNNINKTNQQNPNNIIITNLQNNNNIYPTTNPNSNNIISKNQQNTNNIVPMNQQNPNHLILMNQQNPNNINPTNLKNPKNIISTNQPNQKNIIPTNQQNQIPLINQQVPITQINQLNQNNYMNPNNNNINGINQTNNMLNNNNTPQIQNGDIMPNQNMPTPQIFPNQQMNNKNNNPRPTLNYINSGNQNKTKKLNKKPMENNKNPIKKNNSTKSLSEKKSNLNLDANNNTNKKNNNNNNSGNKKKSNINKLKLNEEILLRNQKIELNKDLDIKAHFDIEVTKERFLFNYKKVLKIAMPLLSHYEMPSDCEYKSPLLSPDGQFLSCIARATDMDTVYVWDLDDLYWFKYNFSSPKSKVDCVAFTPDSKSILIIYRKTNPILYSLENGEKILELEHNGEINKKDGFHWAFTVKAAHFGYTTEKGFTLWSMKSGKIKQHIIDESPIKLLFNEYILSIKNDLNCELKYLKTLKIYLSFKLKGIQNPSEILDARCTPDMSAFIYVIKQGIIKYIFKDKQFKGLQKFQVGVGVEKATISDDCRFVVKTNMRNLTIYDIERGDTIGTILKEKFNEFRIDFSNEKLIVIDNISINIHDYTDGGIPEQFVWLNKNPYRFVDAKFSHDFKFLFGLIDNNNVIAYDLNTGLIIKKWQNIDKNWTNFSISECSGNQIASNSNLFLVKIWNYITGREDATFYGFDSHSFHFSSNGNHLACGAKNGPEVARIWNIEKGTFGSFPYVGNNSNFHTVVHLTSPEPTRLICCSIDQQPLIFDTNSKELLYKCECLYRFEEIYEIKSDQTYDVFIVKGRDVKKRDIGLMYRISDGILLETYENYTVLELAKDNGVIISKCDNVNGGKLTSTDLKNLSDPILNDFQIQNDKIKLLNDNKCVVVVTNSDEYQTEYCLMNAEDGGYFGKINFTKKTERNSENYITIDPIEEFIYFRYFEFLSPQESRNLRNKLFFRNQG